MKRRSLLQVGLLAPLVARAQTPCPAEITGIDGNPVPSGPECGSTDGWPTQRPSYMPVVPNLAGYGCDTLAGYGVNTRGDNVQVHYVTSTATSGTGSLQEVLNRNPGGAAKVIVFNVEGYCTGTNILVNPGNDHITIAGQTAPGKGFCIRGGGMDIGANHVLVQHIHSRPGDASLSGPDDWLLRIGFDVYNGYTSGPTPGPAHHVVIDHCSAQWFGDEGISTYGTTRDCTVAHSIIMEGLDNAQCFMCGGGASAAQMPTRISIIGCLLGHLNHRAPSIRSPALVFVNNIIYNWQEICSDMQSYNNQLQLDLVTAIGNYYKSGPNTGSRRPWWIRGDDRIEAVHVDSKLYLEDNRLNGTVPSPQSNMVTFGQNRSAAQNCLFAPSPYPVWSDGIVPAASALAYDLVLQGVGAFSANRDALDARCINDVINGRSPHSDLRAVSIPSPYPTYGNSTWDHRTQHNYPSGYDPIPDGQSGRRNPGTINASTGRTLIEEWLQRRAKEKQPNIYG